MTIVERFKQESMYGLSAKKSGRCGEMTVSRDSTEVPALFWRGNLIAVVILLRVLSENVVVEATIIKL